MIRRVRVLARLGVRYPVRIAFALGIICAAQGGSAEPPQTTIDKNRDAQAHGAFKTSLSTEALAVSYAGDFNGDGEPDTLTLSKTGLVTVALGVKNMPPVPQTLTYQIGNGPYCITVGDYRTSTGAGCDDVLISSVGANEVYRFMGHTFDLSSAPDRAAFQFDRDRNADPTPVAPTHITLGRFGGDYTVQTFLDLLVISSPGDQIQFWKGDNAGTGIFVLQPAKVSDSPIHVDDVLPGEGTGDKFIDVVISNASGQVRLLRNDGTGKFLQ